MFPFIASRADFLPPKSCFYRMLTRSFPVCANLCFVCGSACFFVYFVSFVVHLISSAQLRVLRGSSLWFRLRRAVSFVVSKSWFSSNDGIVHDLLTRSTDPSASSLQGWCSANSSDSGLQPLHRANALHNLHNLHTCISP